MGVVLCKGGRIIFTDQNGGRTEDHGHWEAWCLKEGTEMLSLTFNWQGSEAMVDLFGHLFYQFVKGVYYNTSKRQVLLLP